ncbi:sigma-54 interaction domain-containing protein [Desulfosarcina ovata]|uniref:ATPase AAA n=1 Tax=Desulfosarcina ovata subsp. ovata TaxID=2752305 RepID=A0A5K8AIB4_9BACT|nr:sigma 54-interacting transcriptional regulator [Desulfosarcina ovata]BBO92216.1 ATPase AAA [Desulfosarcina ovata subsp. ovata]
MNNYLDQNKYSIQSLCNIMKPIIGAELMVINRAMIAVAGTGPYRKNIGLKRPRDSYVDLTIKSGKGFLIHTPREEKQCLQCEIKSFCPYTSVISCPIIYRDKIVGLFGLLGYDKNQHKRMLRKSLFLSKLSDDIGNYIAGKFLKNDVLFYDFVNSEAMNNIVNAIDKGIIITDHKNNIINANQFAEEAMAFKREEYIGKDIELFGDALKIIDSYTISDENGNICRSKFLAKAAPIHYNGSTVGNVLLLKNNAKNKPASTFFTFGNRPNTLRFVGTSDPIIKMKELMAKVAANNSRILINGETGTGKELVAQLIHYNSPKYKGPFVALNCGAIPETLIESELFGYEKGAFTDARKRGRAGKFEKANGGTIFLDEIGNLSLTGQAKILRVLDNAILERIGGEASIKIDVRVICATNKNLPEMVKKKHFMEDLYYRLNVVQIEVPPLRERKTDIPLLLDFYLKEHNQQFGGNLRGFSKRAMSYLVHYQWPGNVRELRNVTEYVCNLKTNGFADIEDLPPYISPLNKIPEKDTIEPIDTEELMVEEALRLFGNSTTGKQDAAKYLGISVSTLYRRLKLRQKQKKNTLEKPF